MGVESGVRKVTIVAAFVVLLLSLPAGAVELSVEYPESALLGEWIELKVTSDEPLSQVSAVVTAGGTTSPVSLFQVDERTFRAAFVPAAAEPGVVTFHISALTAGGEVHTFPAEAPEASPLQIVLVEDTVAPDFIFLSAGDRIEANRLATLIFLVPDASGSVDPRSVEVWIDGEPALSVSVVYNTILAEHVFTSPGRHTVEVRGADRWGNAGSRTFEVSVRGRSLLQTRFSLRTDASLSTGSSQPLSLITRLDGYAQAGGLVLRGHAGLPLAGDPAARRYGLQAEFSFLRHLRFKGSLGEFTAGGPVLVVNTRVQDGLGIEAGVGPLSGAYYSGVVRQGSDDDDKDPQYARNFIGFRAGFGSLFALGGALVSDSFLGSCSYDSDGCFLPVGAKARSNAVLGADFNLGLLGIRWSNSAAASVNFPRITRAVPYTGGPLVRGDEEVSESTHVTPRDFLSEDFYRKFPLPQFDLTELLDTTNPVIVPGVAYRTKLTFPRLFGVQLEGGYEFADAGFDSLVAPGPKGKEALSVKLTIGRGGRSPRLVVSAEDSRKVEKNLFLDALLALAAEAVNAEEGSSGPGSGSDDDEGPVVDRLARTQEVSASLTVPLRSLTLRPSFSYEISGLEEFGPFETLWSKNPGKPIPRERREAEELRAGARVENVRLGPVRLGAGYFRTTAIGYVDGEAQSPVNGNTLELEAQYGAYRVEFALDEEPVEAKVSQHVGASWNGDFVSAGVGLDRRLSGSLLDEERLEFNLSAYLPLGVSAALGGGANYSLVAKSGGETKPVGSVYLYHQWSF